MLRYQIRRIGGVCSTHGRDGNTKFLLGNLKGGDHLKVLGIDGKIILKLTLEK
jgi:hypothetical protein